MDIEDELVVVEEVVDVSLVVVVAVRLVLEDVEEETVVSVMDV